MNRQQGLKIVLVCFCMFLGAGVLKAQYLSFGSTGGLVLSRVGFDPLVLQEFYQGYSVGVICVYEKMREPGVQAEVNFIRRGWHAVSDSLGIYNRSADYISIPVMTHWHAGGKKIRWFLNTGPQIGWLLSSSEHYKPVTPGAEFTFTQRQIYRAWELGINAGTGVQVLMIQKLRIGIELRATQNLTSIFSSGPEGLFFSSRFFSISGLFQFSYILKQKESKTAIHKP